MKYNRVLLKLSGEALMGQQQGGIDPNVIAFICTEIAKVTAQGVQLALVIGGGNIFRGISLATAGMNRVTADQMGMMATVINSLALQDALQTHNIPVQVMSATPMPAICETFEHKAAMAYLQQGKVLIFAGGTGNPFFTTDSAASLRGVEIEAEMIIKATKVDGVYSADPMTDPQALRYTQLSYEEVLEKELAVMDATAILLCKNHQMPLRVYNMTTQDALLQMMQGQDIGTLITAE